MTRDQGAKVLLITSSLEAAAEEACHGPEGAGEEADGGAVEDEEGGEAKVERGQVGLEWNRGEA